MFNRKNGFTLTEVIVVIVIIAALALILIPNMLSLMPDDHNIKYKKAFYTIQEIVNDIANECQGLRYKDGQWTDEGVNAENILSYCYDSSGNPKNLAIEICKRLNTVNGCPSDSDLTSTDSNIAARGILTTDGMRWNLFGGLRLTPNNDGTSPFDSVSCLPDSGNSGLKTIYVDVDGCGSSTANEACINYTKADSGAYAICISETGKVTPATDKEKKLLLDNPTKD